MKKNKILLSLSMILSISLTGCGFFPLLSLLNSTSNYKTPSTIINPSANSANSSGEVISPSVDINASYVQVETKYTYEDVANTTPFPTLPSTGDVNLLVIPVVIEGYEYNATNTNLNNIKTVFSGDSGETSWESLKSFYDKSSFSKLNLIPTVTDWYTCGLTPRELLAKGYPDGDGGTYDGGTWYLLREAVKWYKNTYNDNCKKFDNNGDGLIDAVWLIYSAPNYSNNSSMDENFWAYCFYDQSNQAIPNTFSPNPKLYAWASYDFIFEGYGKTGKDAHTYIHETGHLLGLDDYYDYDYSRAPLGHIDMMDANIIDHNVFSKYALGWIEPYYVIDDGTFRLYPSYLNGEALILAPSHDSAFSEYIMIEYYSPNGLNKKDSDSYYKGNGYQGYTTNGVRIYHVDARLCYRTSSEYVYEDKIYNDKYYVVGQSNTPSYNYVDSQYCLLNMIERDKSASFLKNRKAIGQNSDLFIEGDTFSINLYEDNFVKYRKFNNGQTLSSSLEIVDMTSTYVDIKINI